jgi:hypothetical protein
MCLSGWEMRGNILKIIERLERKCRTRIVGARTSSVEFISRPQQTLPHLSKLIACQNVSTLYRVSDALLGGGKMDGTYSSEAVEPTKGMWLRPHAIAKRIATVNKEIGVIESRIM